MILWSYLTSHINILLIEAIKEMPEYAKFLKDMVSNKRKFEAYETINLFEECSVRDNSSFIGVLYKYR